MSEYFSLIYFIFISIFGAERSILVLHFGFFLLELQLWCTLVHDVSKTTDIIIKNNFFICLPPKFVN